MINFVKSKLHKDTFRAKGLTYYYIIQDFTNGL